MLANLLNYWEYNFFFILIALALIDGAIRKAFPRFYFRFGIPLHHEEYKWPSGLQWHTVADRLFTTKTHHLLEVKPISTHEFGLSAFSISSHNGRTQRGLTLIYAYIHVDDSHQKLKMTIILGWLSILSIICILGITILLPTLLLKVIFVPFCIFILIFSYFDQWEKYIQFWDMITQSSMS